MAVSHSPQRSDSGRTFRFLFSLLWLLSSPIDADEPGPLKYRPLFNGENLEGFYSWLVDTQLEDPRQVFTVTAGQIRISGDGLGYLATREAFTEYDLRLEFRWGDKNWSRGNRLGKAKDSGVFLHATGQDGNSVDGDGAFMAAIECNLFQGATGDFLLIRGRHPDGSLIRPHVKTTVSPLKDADGWLTWDPEGEETTVETWGRINWQKKSPNWKDIENFRGAADREAEYGDWNTLECLVRDDSITIRLNGETINRVTPIFPKQGKILLQCEGSEIFFRRVEIRELISSD